MHITLSIPVIENPDDLQTALKRLRQIFHAPAGTEERYEADVLGLLIEEYERKHYRFDPLPLNEFIKVCMEDKGLEPKDLYPVFNGSRSRVSEVLAGKKVPTLEQFKALAKVLNVPLAALIESTEEK